MARGFVFTLDAVFALIVASAATSILLYISLAQPGVSISSPAQAAGGIETLLTSNASMLAGMYTAGVSVLPAITSGSPDVPAGIVAYVPITLTNSQSAATPAPFQQPLAIEESRYSDFITYNGYAANMELFSETGNVLPSWIGANESGTLYIYVKLLSGIGAGQSVTIYLGFASKSTNLLSSGGTTGIGEAPQLTCGSVQSSACQTYAEYDDGASVFSNYWNFAGAALPSGWAGLTASGWSVDNGLSITAQQSAVEYQGAAFSSNVILGFYGYIGQPTGTNNFNPEGFSPNSVQTTGPVGNFWIGDQSSGNYVYGYDTGGTTPLYSTSPIAVNTPSTFSIWLNGAAALYQTDYQQMQTSYAQQASNNYIWYSWEGNGGAPTFIQWSFISAYPPNGVMPASEFYAVQPSISTLQAIADIYMTTYADYANLLLGELFPNQNAALMINHSYAPALEASEFNGVSSNVVMDYPALESMPASDTLTLTAWISDANTISDSPPRQEIINAYASFLNIQSGGLCFWVIGANNGNGGYLCSAAGTVPANTTVFVAATYSTGNEVLYINGAQVLSHTYPNTPSSSGSASAIGYCVYCGGGEYFPGTILDVQAYNTVLSAQQLHELYAAGAFSPPLFSTNSVSAWWPLEGNANDLSGNGYNGVAVGVGYGAINYTPPSMQGATVVSSASVPLPLRANGQTGLYNVSVVIWH